MKGFFTLIFFFGSPNSYIHAQYKRFVPLEYEYPENLLSTPKTYVYKNPKTDAFRYTDVALERNGDCIMVHWKEYDRSSIGDSCTEINGKGFDRYMLMNNVAIKAGRS